MSQERLEQRGMYVGGSYRDADETFTVADPSTGDSVALVADAGPDGVDAALDSARAAQAEWAATDPIERGRIMRDVSRALEDHVDELAELVTRENGRPIGQSRLLVGSAVDYVDYYAGMTDKIEGESVSTSPSQQAFTRRDPVGVSAQVVPWNAPALLCFRGVAPALAAGNSVVLIEHNLDLIAEADWVLDMGPDGGDGGGRVVAEGPPEALVGAGSESETGRVLKAFLDPRRRHGS